MNKICVYTCITGNYDQLHIPAVIDNNIDYICFTDNQNLKSNIWKILPIPNELKYLSLVKQQRIIKICPHRYLSDYDISIWIDGNIRICNSLNDFISQYDLNKIPFYTRIHPHRNCIYTEAKKVIDIKKDSTDIVQIQIDKYKKEKYPEKIGMVETGILLRKHNNNQCKLLCYAWAEELLKHSHRDQLSFNYICWKYKFIPGYLANEFYLNKNNFFKIVSHCK